MSSILKMGISYTGKFVLAPMVRIGELPTRLVSLKHGADLVWGPEIIDKKIISFQRIENKDLGTIDFIASKDNHNNNAGKNKNKNKNKNNNGPIVSFRTHRPTEEGKLIFQMGTANADLAVQAANVIIDDVDGIDINAGCPKHFSIHAGMGAALLQTPDLLCEILTRLVNEVGKPKNKPISVKIRLLENREKTVELVEKLLKTGISNLTVHCRTREMRNRESPIRDYIPYIIPKCKEHNVSFIINGGITSRQEYRNLQKEFGEDVGCMVAEAAEENPSVFAETPAHWAQVSKQLVQFASQYNNHIGNTKYCLGRIIPGKAKVYQKVSQAKTLEDLNVLMENLTDDGMIKNYDVKERKQKGLTQSLKNQQADQPSQIEQKTQETIEKGTVKRALEQESTENADLANTNKKLKLNDEVSSKGSTVAQIV